MANGIEQKTMHTGRNSRWRMIIFLLMFLMIITFCALYFRLAVKPLDSCDISPEKLPERWRFTLSDGKLLLPEDGKFPLASTDSLVICEMNITDDVLSDALLVVSSTSSDCVFFLNGELFYSPSGRYADGRFSDEPYVRNSASGQAEMHLNGKGDILTVIVQYQGEENRVSRLPKLTLYPEVMNYLSKYTGPVAESAQDTGGYAIISLIVAGLFLVGIWKKQQDYSLIPLAISSLAMAFKSSSSYAYSVILLFSTPTITWLCTLMPLAAMSWMLWFRLRKKLRLIILPIPGAVTAAMLVIFIIGLNNMNYVSLMHIMTAWVLPSAFLVMLCAAAIDAAKGNRLLRRFFRYLLWSVPVVAFVWLISFITDGKLAQSLNNAVTAVTGANPTLYFLCDHMCTLLLIISFILAIVELIENIARMDAELQALTMRERYAAENLEIMQKSQEETRKQKHELNHHLTLLKEMLSEAQSERAAAYIAQLMEQAEAIPTGRYSDNMVVNAIAGHYLNQAKAEGIRVDTNIRAGKSLPVLRDEDLCILLTNLLENALESCRSAKEEQEPFISFSLTAGEDHISIICENSMGFPVTVSPDGTVLSSKPDTAQHGYGIPAMRGIVDKYFGMMEISASDSSFHTEITI